MQANIINVFADGLALIEKNLTPYDVNNLRIALHLPIIDLRKCTHKQVIQGIKDGVDFRELHFILDQRYWNHYDEYIPAIKARNEYLGYKWFCRIPADQLFIKLICLFDDGKIDPCYEALVYKAVNDLLNMTDLSWNALYAIYHNIQIFEDANYCDTIDKQSHDSYSETLMQNILNMMYIESGKL